MMLKDNTDEEEVVIFTKQVETLAAMPVDDLLRLYETDVSIYFHCSFFTALEYP